MENIINELKDLILCTDSDCFLKCFDSNKKEYQIHFLFTGEEFDDIILQDKNVTKPLLVTPNVKAVLEKTVLELGCTEFEVVGYDNTKNNI